jgi:Tol biopolymer transport system component/DNA-binding winged helix-turn-helix (wHTH) protein
MNSTTLVNFGPFTFDLSAGTLWRDGEAVALQPLPTSVLRTFLLRPRQVVSKEQLRESAWDGLIVADNTIYKQVSILRRTLGRSQGGAWYIVTRSKKGWVFQADVQSVPDRTFCIAGPYGGIDGPRKTISGLQAAKSREFSWPKLRYFQLRSWFGVLGPLALLACLVTVLAYVSAGSRPVARVLQFTRLTNDGHLKWGPIVMDGHRIFLNELVDGFERVVSAPLNGGDPEPLRAVPPGMSLHDISPNKLFLLLRSGSFEQTTFWIYSLPRASMFRLRNGGVTGAWSGSRGALTFAGKGVISFFDLGCASEKKLLGIPGGVDYLTWSADGNLLRFVTKNSGGDPTGTWEFDARHAVTRKLPQFSAPSHWARHGVWSPNGRDFVYSAQGADQADLWIAKEKDQIARSAAPIRLTNGPGSWMWPSFKSNGRDLLAIHEEWRSELSYFDSGRREWRPAWGAVPAYELDYSRDGQWVTFVYTPNHTVWKSRVDGSARVQLTSGGIVAHQPHWSPDGQRIAFMGQKPGGVWRVYIISVQGGRAEEVLPQGDDQGVPTWSPDGQEIMFGELLGRKPTGAMCLHRLDLVDHTAKVVPGTNGLWSPRWSPDGKHVLAVTTDNRSIRIGSPDWTYSDEVVRMQSVDNVMWSYDSKYIYFDGRLQLDDAQDIYRVDVASRKLEKLAEMRNFLGTKEGWYGVSPNGTLLASRRYVIQEVYALHCDLR